MEFLKLLQEKLGEEIFTEELQEEFKAQIDVLISEKVLAEKEVMEEQFKEDYEAKKVELEESLRKEADEYKSELTESIDGYLEYATKEFFAENKVAIQNEYTVKAATELVEALATVLENNHFTVDVDHTKKEQALEEKISKVEAKYKSLVKENIDLKGEISEQEKALKFTKLTEGLSKAKVDKVLALTEGMTFKDSKDFERKIKICIENLKEKTAVEKDEVKEDLTESIVTEVKQSSVSKYF
jgi:hypothetical protein